MSNRAAALWASGLLLAWLGAAAGRAFGAEAAIQVKLPYNIAYDLAPIEIDVTAKGGSGLSYRIFDTFKNELAQGALEENVKQTVTFTPPRFGWYVI